LTHGVFGVAERPAILPCQGDLSLLPKIFRKQLRQGLNWDLPGFTGSARQFFADLADKLMQTKQNGREACLSA
jgi:hypothetical protein